MSKGWGHGFKCAGNRVLIKFLVVHQHRQEYKFDFDEQTSSKHTSYSVDSGFILYLPIHTITILLYKLLFYGKSPLRKAIPVHRLITQRNMKCRPPQALYTSRTSWTTTVRRECHHLRRIQITYPRSSTAFAVYTSAKQAARRQPKPPLP